MRGIRRLSIRWKLALISAGLTFVILMLFALVVGLSTAQRLDAEFNEELKTTADTLSRRMDIEVPENQYFGRPRVDVNPALQLIPEDGALRVVSPQEVYAWPPDAPDLGVPGPGITEANGYRVVTGTIEPPSGEFTNYGVYFQYGVSESRLRETRAGLASFLLLGVVGGTLLALLAGLAVARRAMEPIGALTRAARQVARTRDPDVRLPRPEADDEVADLSRTLDEMLHALDAAQEETEGALARQREFVADASHELRTPLTSILANLELLEATLGGEDREIAAAALSSSRRMRRLVGDLLLLARADAGHRPPPSRVDLSDVIAGAAAETVAIAGEHELSMEARPGLWVCASADELHRLVLNLLENAVRHTPPGSRVHAAAYGEGDCVVLTVEDDGPGVPPALRSRIFERFVSAEGEVGGGTGLGLAIVRAVAEREGGSVRVEDAPGGGARFVVSLPAAPPAPAPERAPAGAGGGRLLAGRPDGGAG